MGGKNLLVDMVNIGINSFGESGPGVDVANHFGITPKSIYDKIVKKMNS